MSTHGIAIKAHELLSGRYLIQCECGVPISADDELLARFNYREHVKEPSRKIGVAWCARCDELTKTVLERQEPACSKCRSPHPYQEEMDPATRARFRRVRAEAHDDWCLADELLAELAEAGRPPNATSELVGRVHEYLSTKRRPHD